LSRISDLNLWLVRILRFSCLMRNELASKANSCRGREVLLANSRELSVTGRLLTDDKTSLARE